MKREILAVAFVVVLGALMGRVVGEEGGREVKVALVLEPPGVVRGDGVGWRVVLRNEGKGAVTLVLPGDGSFAGMRSPVVTWTVGAVTGGEVREVRQLREDCKTINDARAEEVFVLLPGERREIGTGPRFDGAGRYRVRVQYVNAPGMRWSRGDEGSAVMRRIRGSTGVDVVSEVVEVEVGE